MENKIELPIAWIDEDGRLVRRSDIRDGGFVDPDRAFPDCWTSLYTRVTPERSELPEDKAAALEYNKMEIAYARKYHSNDRKLMKIHETIRKALLICDKLMADPSEGMKQAFISECEANMTNWGIKLKGFEDGIKSMVSQLIKEIEQTTETK